MVELARKVLKNSLFNLSSALIKGLGGFIFSVIIARILTPNQYGIYALAVSICFLIMHIDFGIGYSSVRYLAYAVGKNSWELARGYFKFFFKIRIALGLFYAILLAVLSNNLAYYFEKPELLIPLKILSIFLFFYFLIHFLYCCFQAFQDFKYYAIGNLIYESLRFLLAIPLALIFFNGIFIGLSLASLITFFVVFLIFKKIYSYIFVGESEKSEKIDVRRVLRFMGFVSIGNFSVVVFSYIDIIMLGMFLPAEYVGYYKAATNIILGIAGLTGLAQVLFPVFTQLEGKSLENAFTEVFRYACILSFPFAVSLAYFSQQIVGIIYGVNYLPAALPLFILSPIIIFNATNFFGVLFGAKEKPEYETVVSITSMTINVVLNYILILKCGMVGAAIATTISRFFNIAARGIIAMKVFGIYPDVDSIYKPFISSLLMFLFLYILPHPDTLFLGIFELLGGFIIYFFILFLIKGIRPEDIIYIKNI